MTGDPLFRSVYGADPTARVINNKLWIYVSHDPSSGPDGKPQFPVPDDLPQAGYSIQEYRTFAASSKDKGVTAYGTALNINQVPWARKMMWAPEVAQAKSGKIVLFVPAMNKEGMFKVGVAIADHPWGPFISADSPMKKSHSIDPMLLQDDNDVNYLFTGGLWGGQLEMWEGPTKGQKAPGVDEGMPVDQGNETALGPLAALMTTDLTQLVEKPKGVVITDELGVPLRANDTERKFFEASWVVKRQGVYYLSYSTGTTHKMVYATSVNPLGPYRFKGTLLPPVVGWTTHGAIVEFDGVWWLLHADASLSNGVSNQRCIKVKKIGWRDDEQEMYVTEHSPPPSPPPPAPMPPPSSTSADDDVLPSPVPGPSGVPAASKSDGANGGRGVDVTSSARSLSTSASKSSADDSGKSDESTTDDGSASSGLTRVPVGGLGGASGRRTGTHQKSLLVASAL